MIIDKYGMYMQHLDQSYSSLERAKFKGWHTKWMHVRIPLLVCLSIEVLSPAKLLSKTFQSEDVDAIATASLSLNNLDNNYHELTVRVILSCLPLKDSLIRLKRAMTTYILFSRCHY